MNEGIGIGDALALSRNNDCCDGLGGNSWIGLIIILAILGGGIGGFGGWGGSAGGAAWNGALTRAELYDSQQFQTIEQNQVQMMRDNCQSTATLSNQINNRAYEGQLAMNAGFNNIVNGITQVGYQLQDCCCGINRNIDGVNFNIQNQTMQLMNNENANTQKILDTLCGMKMEAKDQRIAELTQIVNNQQLAINNASIVNELRPPAPVPAYNVAAPWYSGGYYSARGCCNA